MPFTTTLMVFDDAAQLLYAFNRNDKSLYVIEQMTANGIPFRWLTHYGLPTDAAVEAQDPDNDGLNTLQEWFLDSDPAKATPGLQLDWTSDFSLTVPDTSLARLYDLDHRINAVVLSKPDWSESGIQISFPVQSKHIALCVVGAPSHVDSSIRAGMASTVGNPASSTPLLSDNNMSVMAFLSSPVLLNRFFPRDWRFTIIVNHLAQQ